MPWQSREELPEALRKATEHLSDKEMKVWLRVVNRRLRKGDSESEAIKKAWGAVRRMGNEMLANQDKYESGNFDHTSQTADDEPDWGNVDKTPLPPEAYGNWPEGPEFTLQKKGSWSHPHHHIVNGEMGENDIYTSGTLYVNRGGVAAAWAAAQGARSGVKANDYITNHIDEHRSDLGMTENELLGMAVGYARDQGCDVEKLVANHSQFYAEHIMANQDADPVLPKLSADVPDEVELVRAGRWEGHPKQPQIIRKEHIRAAYDWWTRHYQNNDAQLVIDYHHQSIQASRGQSSRAEAAGWVTDVRIADGGSKLIGEVEWTEEAATYLENQEYRYLSPVLVFNAQDRNTGAEVPMAIHSLALTNTPFMTELESLNQALAAEYKGDEEMSLLEKLKQLLNEEQFNELAAELGIEDTDEAEEADVATALYESIQSDEEGENEEPEAVPEEVANTLGIDPGSEVTDAKAKILQLQGQDGLAAVKNELDLGSDADQSDMLSAVQDLKDQKAEGQAEKLVANAVEAGKIPPSNKDFWLNSAKEDLESTRKAINNMPTVASGADERDADTPDKGEDGLRELTEEEKEVCNQLGQTKAEFLGVDTADEE